MMGCRCARPVYAQTRQSATLVKVALGAFLFWGIQAISQSALELVGDSLIPDRLTGYFRRPSEFVEIVEL